uniref:Uncharacterized protein n=1 Tax=Amphimedon queenslandica TaxID=400682 RepID=A0A1X7TJM9_AMPQE
MIRPVTCYLIIKRSTITSILICWHCFFDSKQKVINASNDHCFVIPPFSTAAGTGLC